MARGFRAARRRRPRCGTGKLTRSLVVLGHRVTAVEPLPEMIAHLRDAVPGVTAVEGGAEAMSLVDESADVVVAAQAFHWFDRGPALREIARVLRPGGHIALVWNTRDEREPWVAQLSKEALTSEGFVERDAVLSCPAVGGVTARASVVMLRAVEHGDQRERSSTSSYSFPSGARKWV
ncbi:MAG: class I SAM-dependent methyltransferase [Thermoleophilia bacterium]|nr:class I SAM-dependent methyltransferase [Thermoleophilia bacterium]